MFCTDFDVADYHRMPITGMEEHRGAEEAKQKHALSKGHAEMSRTTKITICQNFSTLVF